MMCEAGTPHERAKKVARLLAPIGVYANVWASEAGLEEDGDLSIEAIPLEDGKVTIQAIFRGASVTYIGVKEDLDTSDGDGWRDRVRPALQEMKAIYISEMAKRLENESKLNVAGSAP